MLLTKLGSSYSKEAFQRCTDKQPLEDEFTRCSDPWSRGCTQSGARSFSKSEYAIRKRYYNMRLCEKMKGTDPLSTPGYIANPVSRGSHVTLLV